MGRAYVNRPGEHLMLRLASGDSDFIWRWRHMLKTIKESLAEDVPIRRRRVAARLVLSALNSAQLIGVDLDQFRLEWLTLVKHLDDPVLLYHHSLSELHVRDLQLVPHAWGPLRTSLPDPVVPRIAPRISEAAYAPEQLDWSDPANVSWRKAIELAFEAVARNELSSWDAEECQAAMSCVVLSSVLGVPQQHMQRKCTFFEGQGTGLMSALNERLQSASGTDLLSTWWSTLRTKVLLHCRGQNETGPPGRADSHADARSPAAGLCMRPVVLEPIPPARDRADRETTALFEPLRSPQPVAAMPEKFALEAKVAELRNEFPWAGDAIDRLADLLTPPCLLGVKDMTMRPVLLVGAPGAGKSRLARRVAETLALPFMAIPCGGSSDGKVLMGTTRGWSTGEPSPILGLLLRKKTASAFILLDELDKVGHRYSNGPALDAALLGLLEPETASRWRDGFLQAECDLSRVTFWATANSLTRISRPLLSRFEIVHVPEPGPQHVQRLADSMIAQLETDWGLSPGVLPRRTIALPRGQRVNARELRTYLQRALAEWCRSEFTERRLH